MILSNENIDDDKEGSKFLDWNRVKLGCNSDALSLLVKDILNANNYFNSLTTWQPYLYLPTIDNSYLKSGAAFCHLRKGSKHTIASMDIDLLYSSTFLYDVEVSTLVKAVLKESGILWTIDL